MAPTRLLGEDLSFLVVPTHNNVGKSVKTDSLGGLEARF